jgi:hypothetical protein
MRDWFQRLGDACELFFLGYMVMLGATDHKKMKKSKMWEKINKKFSLKKIWEKVHWTKFQKISVQKNPGINLLKVHMKVI